MAFLKLPHLPTQAVTLCAVSVDAPAVIDALIQHGIACLPVPPHPNLPTPLCTHADMQLFDLGQGRVLLPKSSQSLAQNLSAQGFSLIWAQEPAEQYPYDIPLNAALIGKHCFGKLPYIDKNITIHCREQSIQLVNVNQGYAKCSICIISDHALITADPSITHAAEACRFDVLQITPGHIRLDGYDTGFIGGCTGLIASDLLAFTGTLRHHPDNVRIKAFLRHHRVGWVELTDTPLWDIGSILPLQEGNPLTP